MSHNATPCKIRDVEYPSFTAAAKALGISRSCVSSLVSQGRVDQAGIGTGRWRREDCHKPAGTEVSFFGRRFPSIRAAARELGVPYSTLQRARRNPAEYRELLVGRLMALQAQREAQQRRMQRPPE